MKKALHLQQTVPAAPRRVFRALSESAELEKWFAERADVSLAEGRYDFWGRFTPESPSRDGGRHRIEESAPDAHLRFRWPLRGADTMVDIRLIERGADTVIDVRHRGIPRSEEPGMAGYAIEDVWFLALENLKRHLARRDVVRCDFSGDYVGEIRHTIEVDGPPDAVWRALIEPSQLNRWIASNATVEPRVGGAWDLGWGSEGSLRILSLDPLRELSLGWEVDGTQTVVTWTLEGSGGATRVTIVHSGFGPDERVGGLGVGWLHYLLWVKSLVEFGPDWMPAIKEVSKNLALFYAASIWAAQDDLLESGESDGQTQ